MKTTIGKYTVEGDTKSASVLESQSNKEVKYFEVAGVTLMTDAFVEASQWAKAQLVRSSIQVGEYYIRGDARSATVFINRMNREFVVKEFKCDNEYPNAFESAIAWAKNPAC